jgi:hypothetical protein
MHLQLFSAFIVVQRLILLHVDAGFFGGKHEAGHDAAGADLLCEDLVDLVCEYLFLGFADNFALLAGEVPEVGLGPAVDYGVSDENSGAGCVGPRILFP